MKNSSACMFNKILSCLVLLTFVSTNASAVPINQINRNSSLHHDGIEIPSLANDLQIPDSLGSIEKRISTSGPTIIHIQDAHGSYEAQVNTRKILETLKENYDVKLILLEGGFGKLKPEQIQFFNEADLARATADDLAKKGIVGGAELFLLNELLLNHPRSGFGIEDKTLYLENLKAFRAVIRQKPETDKFLSNFKTEVVSQSSVVFNKELKSFFKKWLFYQDVKSELMAHLNALSDYGLKVLKLDLSDARNQLDWPQLVRFFKLKNLEKGYDVRKVDEEKRKLIEWASRNGIYGTYIECLRDLKEECYSSKQNKYGSVRNFIERFYEVASKKGFKFSDYPDFTKDAGMRILQDELEATKLFREVEKLTDQILVKLAQSKEEQELISIYRDYVLIAKLFSLELTAQEYRTLQERAAHLKPSAISNRLGVVKEASRKKVNGKTNDIVALDAIFEQAIDFYQGTAKREQAIMDHVIQRMKDTKKTKAVLVTGGFHAEGLHELFNINHLSYVSILPHLSEVPDPRTYLQVMMLGDLPTRTAHIKALLFAQAGLGEVAPNTFNEYLGAAQESVRKIAPSRAEVRSFFENLTKQKKEAVSNEIRKDITYFLEKEFHRKLATPISDDVIQKLIENPDRIKIEIQTEPPLKKKNLAKLYLAFLAMIRRHKDEIKSEAEKGNFYVIFSPHQGSAAFDELEPKLNKILENTASNPERHGYPELFVIEETILDLRSVWEYLPAHLQSQIRSGNEMFLDQYKPMVQQAYETVLAKEEVARKKEDFETKADRLQKTERSGVEERYGTGGFFSKFLRWQAASGVRSRFIPLNFESWYKFSKPYFTYDSTSQLFKGNIEEFKKDYSVFLKLLSNTTIARDRAALELKNQILSQYPDANVVYLVGSSHLMNKEMLVANSKSFYEISSAISEEDIRFIGYSGLTVQKKFKQETFNSDNPEDLDLLAQVYFESAIGKNFPMKDNIETLERVFRRARQKGMSPWNLLVTMSRDFSRFPIPTTALEKWKAKIEWLYSHDILDDTDYQILTRSRAEVRAEKPVQRRRVQLKVEELEARLAPAVTNIPEGLLKPAIVQTIAPAQEQVQILYPKDILSIQSQQISGEATQEQTVQSTFTAKDLENQLKNFFPAVRIVPTGNPNFVAALAREDDYFGKEHLFLYSTMGIQRLHTQYSLLDPLRFSLSIDDTEKIAIVQVGARDDSTSTVQIHVYRWGSGDQSLLTREANFRQVKILDEPGPRINIEIYPNFDRSIPGGTRLELEVELGGSIKIIKEIQNFIPQDILERSLQTFSNKDFRIVERKLVPIRGEFMGEFLGNYYDLTNKGRYVTSFVQSDKFYFIDRSVPPWQTGTFVVRSGMGVPDASPDGRYVISGLKEIRYAVGIREVQQILIRSGVTGNLERSITLKRSPLVDPGMSVEFFPGTSRIVQVTYVTGDMEYYDVETGLEVPRPPQPDASIIQRLLDERKLEFEKGQSLLASLFPKDRLTIPEIGSSEWQLTIDQGLKLWMTQQVGSQPVTVEIAVGLSDRTLLRARVLFPTGQRFGIVTRVVYGKVQYRILGREANGLTVIDEGLDGPTTPDETKRRKLGEKVLQLVEAEEPLWKATYLGIQEGPVLIRMPIEGPNSFPEFLRDDVFNIAAQVVHEVFKDVAPAILERLEAHNASPQNTPFTLILTGGASIEGLAELDGDFISPSVLGLSYNRIALQYPQYRPRFGINVSRFSFLDSLRLIETMAHELIHGGLQNFFSDEQVERLYLRWLEVFDRTFWFYYLRDSYAMTNLWEFGAVAGTAFLSTRRKEFPNRAIQIKNDPETAKFNASFLGYSLKNPLLPDLHPYFEKSEDMIRLLRYALEPKAKFRVVSMQKSYDRLSLVVEVHIKEGYWPVFLTLQSKQLPGQKDVIEFSISNGTEKISVRYGILKASGEYKLIYEIVGRSTVDIFKIPNDQLRLMTFGEILRATFFSNLIPLGGMEKPRTSLPDSQIQFTFNPLLNRTEVFASTPLIAPTTETFSGPPGMHQPFSSSFGVTGPSVVTTFREIRARVDNEEVSLEYEIEPRSEQGTRLRIQMRHWNGQTIPIYDEVHGRGEASFYELEVVRRGNEDFLIIRNRNREVIREINLSKILQGLSQTDARDQVFRKMTESPLSHPLAFLSAVIATGPVQKIEQKEKRKGSSRRSEVRSFFENLTEKKKEAVSVVNLLLGERHSKKKSSQPGISRSEMRGLAEDIDDQIIKPLLSDAQLDPAMKPYIEELMRLPKIFDLRGVHVIETELYNQGQPAALNFNPDLFRAFLNGMKQKPDVGFFVRAAIVKESGIIRFTRENPNVSKVFYESLKRIFEYERTVPDASRVQISENSDIYRLIRHYVSAWVQVEYASLQHQVTYMRAKGLVRERTFKNLAKHPNATLRNYFSDKVGYEKFLLATEKEQKLTFLAGYYQAFSSLSRARQVILEVLARIEHLIDERAKTQGTPVMLFTVGGLSKEYGQRSIKFMDFLMDPNVYSVPIENLPNILARSEAREIVPPIVTASAKQIEAIFGEEIQRSKAEQLLQKELKKEKSSFESMLEVVRITRGVFGFEKARLIGKAIMNQLLQSLMPNEHRNPEKVNDSFIYLSRPQVAENQSIQIVVSFEELPKLDHPSFQVILDFLSHNKFARVQVVVPNAKRDDLTQLERQAVLQVLERRADHGIVSRGVNLSLTNQEANVPRFLTNQTRTLVYSSDRAFLEPHKNRLETLLVNDNAPLKQKSFALLAAINSLMEQKVIPSGIQAASNILRLLENMKIAKQAEKATLSAA